MKVAFGEVIVGTYTFDRAAYGQNEAAHLLGVTRQHVAAQVARGNIRSVRIGARVLIPAVEIARLLGPPVAGDAA